MKITDVDTILLTGPCSLDPYISEARKLRSAAFIKIETDVGIVGIGETYAGYFLPEAVPPIVDFFKPVLLGNNVDDIPELWDRMYHSGNFWCRVGIGAAVLCGIEAALWDLKGKQLEMPVYELLQGAWRNNFKETEVLTQIPCYATGGPSNFPIDKLVKKVEYYMSLGFKGVKIGAGSYEKNTGFNIPTLPEEAAELEAGKMDYLRKQFGSDVWLMLDAHMGNSPQTWDFETALAVAKSLESYDLLFLEEPLNYTRPELYDELCRKSSTPIAGGECLTSVSEWFPFIKQESFHVGQPDASFTAGLYQCMEIAALLDQQERKIAPHAWGAGGSQMQNVHCGFACPNTLIIEVAPAYGPLHYEIIGDSLKIKDGYIQRPTEPGLGITLSVATIKNYPFVPGTGEFNSVPGKILNT